MAEKREKNRVIEIEDLSFSYGETTALTDVSFYVNERDFFGIIGPNGGGKTTLLRIILGLEHVKRGKVTVFGKRPAESFSKIGYVPQYAKFDFNFPITVWDVVLSGRLSRAPLFGGYRAEDKEIAEEALSTFGIAHLKGRKLGSLSGGERQRVLIARALVSQPELLLLDEPTSSVDVGAEGNIYEILEDLNRDITIVIVSHDVSFITSHVKKVACVNKSLVCHPAQKITSSDIDALYHAPMHLIDHKHNIEE